MQLASHELYDLHELIVSCVNSITNMAMFKSIVQDQDLKNILDTHFPAHIQDYNMKVEFLKKAEGTNQKLNVPNLNVMLQNFTSSPSNSFPPIAPRTDVQKMNDREIATAYLLTLKRAGREYAWSAMEMSNPEIREFLKDAFTMSCNHAYDVWQWMVQKGFYPLSPADRNEQNTISSMYNEVNQTVPTYL
ncbi:spore coat protein [Clostridium felsineum]|uniref:spore coat protein n=1 Tax=Clostridium felsineum TaxID=36839 RepID=UPI00214D64EB|nr:spore coat protein [Clostridium felsineum]MCR3758113.1 spore coat protein [Clostridium felsineum]